MVWPIFGRFVQRDRGCAERIVVGDVVLDPATGWVGIGGWVVRAPGREAQLLEQLMRYPGRVLATDALACSLQTDRDRVARLARRLRRRLLMVDPLRPPLIEVVPHSGYRFLSAHPVDATVPRRDEQPGATSPRRRSS